MWDFLLRRRQRRVPERNVKKSREKELTERRLPSLKIARPEGRGRPESWQSAKRNLHVCRVMTLLRTRIDSGVPQDRVLDPTSHRRGGGWACKHRSPCWLPAG